MSDEILGSGSKRRRDPFSRDHRIRRFNGRTPQTGKRSIAGTVEADIAIIAGIRVIVEGVRARTSPSAVRVGKRTSSGNPKLLVHLTERDTIASVAKCQRSRGWAREQ